MIMFETDVMIIISVWFCANKKLFVNYKIYIYMSHSTLTFRHINEKANLVKLDRERGC